MLPRRGVGPAARDAGAVETDEQRPPAGTVEIARDPVAALPPAMRQVAPADGLSVQAERRGDGGGVHGAAPAGRRKRDGRWGMRSLLQCIRDARYRPASASRRRRSASVQAKRGREARTVLAPDRQQKERPTREAPAQSGGNDVAA